MTLWIDAQLSPFIALWINENFRDINAKSLRSIGLRDATDLQIFEEARAANVTMMSKDQDFVRLIELHGSPPKLIWITCGNTSNAGMCAILQSFLQDAIDLLNSGEPIVEISNKFS
jgi:predicted nuclease of predicted toxin-antitoxin system